MENQHNQSIYRIYAPIYDIAMRPFSDAARRRALDLVAAQPGERLLIPGVGTGLDLPLISDSIHITATDLSSTMLRQARSKAIASNVTFAIMDAQTLGFPDASFDAVLLNLNHQRRTRWRSSISRGMARFASWWARCDLR